MARVVIDDLPHFVQLDDCIRLKHGIERMSVDEVTLLVDPVSGGWYGLQKDQKRLAADLDFGYSAYDLIGVHGSRARGVIDQLARRGLLEGRDLPESQYRCEIPSPALRYTMTLASGCNLACIYCSSNASPLGSTMKESTLYQAIDSIFATPSETGYEIHFGGGEVLLAFDLMQKAVAYSDRVKPGEVRFSIQTNGTLLDRHKVEWLSNKGVHVGLSIDGPAQVQNQHRPFANGQPSFAQVMNGIHLLREAGIEFHSLATITASHQFALLFDFMLEFDIKGFFVRTALLGGRQKQTFSPSMQERLAAAHLDFFDRILKHYDETGIKLHEERISRLLREILSPLAVAPSMPPCPACHRVIAIASDGSIYPCDRFVGAESLRLGDVTENVPVVEMIRRSPVTSRFVGRTWEKISKCSSCIFRRFCKGGCTCSSYERFGDIERESEQCTHNKTMLLGLMSRVIRQPDLIARYQEASWK